MIPLRVHIGHDQGLFRYTVNSILFPGIKSDFSIEKRLTVKEYDIALRKILYLY